LKLFLERLLGSFVSAFFLVGFSLMGSSVSASSGITYQGRLLAPSGVPVTSSNVQFKLQIRTPGIEDCLLLKVLFPTWPLLALSWGEANTHSAFEGLTRTVVFGTAEQKISFY
jgi:hypothetical protein